MTQVITRMPSVEDPVDEGDVVVVVGEQRAVLAPEGRAVLGRHPASNIVVDQPDVSRVHCAVFMNDGEVYVVDYASSNGTRVDDDVLPPHIPVRINRDTSLTLGRTVVSLEPMAAQ